MKKETVNENGLNADFFYDDSGKSRKAVILWGGSEGGKSWSNIYKERVEQLVCHGYCALSLAYFGAAGLPMHLRHIPLEYFEKAFNWLANRSEVIPNNYALIGYSRGGELALLLGSRYHQVRAVVALAPSFVVFPAPPKPLSQELPRHYPAWTYMGQALPYVPMRFSLATVKGLFTGKQVKMFQEALQNAPRVEAATIPVEKTQGPILLISGTRDETWPSTFMCDQVVKRLESKGFEFHYEHVAYETGHSVLDAKGCWPKILAFLTKYFK